MIRFLKIPAVIMLWLLSISAHTQPSVVELEYFFDDDPGYGSPGATTVVVPAPSENVSLQELIPTTGLSVGFHVLYVRARVNSWVRVDSADTEGVPPGALESTLVNGVWGIPESRLVYVDESGADAILVDQVEAFFDRDPGYGNATSVGVFSPASSLTFSDMIATDTLATGFHTLFIRARGVGGVWGLPEQRLIYVDVSGAVANVDHIEYFFDTDPGYGSGDSLTAFTAAASVNVLDNISTTGLSLGFHTLYIRPRLAGGTWGLPEQRLIYVDASGGVANVDHVEYFFDEDPGYGNGDSLASFTTASSVNLLDNIPTSSLATGFHVLYIRARLEGGVWGIPEQRLVYVDETGATIANIDRLEYFIDNDPGYGSATAIPVTPAGTDIYREVAMAAASLGEGQHFAGVRARDENGRWSIPEIINFYAYSAGRELDSASLVVLFNKTGGNTWSNKTNWLSTNVENWYGVTVTNGRVDSLDLKGNLLTGELPRELGYVLNLSYLDLSQNALRDTIPSTIGDLTLLEELRLNGNSFNEIPDFSATLTSLNTLALDTNQFDFGDLEPYVGLANFTYGNQTLFNDFPEDSTVAVGQTMAIDKSTDGANNTYQWLLNGDSIAFADFDIHTIASFSPSDTGNYVLKVRNSLLPNLELVSSPYYLMLSDFEEDSLALVSLYNRTNGAAWTTSTNWLTGNLDTWSGVTVTNERVTGLTLPGNNLDGKIPEDFGYADSLVSIDISNNFLKDTIPGSWEGFKALASADLSENDFTKLPNFAPLVGAGSLNTMDISGNRIGFAEIEQNVSIPAFTYSPMDTLTAARDTLFDASTNPQIVYMGSSSNNNYQWLKNGVAVTAPNFTQEKSGSTSTLTFNDAQFEDEGEYVLRITNSVVTDLTLYTGRYVVGITSLLRDSVALVAFYEATGGDGWTSATNWNSGAVGTWEGVVLNDVQDRVIGLNLPDNNLQNTVPTKIRDITSLETADWSGNSLVSIPNLSVMPNLTTLDISSNQIGFAEIIINQPIQNFIYNPQDPLGQSVAERIPVGTSYTFDAAISGVGNKYQWRLQGNDITGATSEVYQLQSIEYDSMGVYTVAVTNDLVPDFTLVSNDIEVLATADIAGVVYDPDNTALASGGNVSLWKIRDGPYDSIDVVSIDVAGNYLIEDVVLDDYILRATPDDTSLFVSYYPETNVWTEAGQVQLRDQSSTYDISIVGKFSEAGVEDDVLGLVEAELEGSSGESGRIEARRKVKRAGCSLRRRTRGSGGRTEQDFDLYYYTETNDEGKFVFKDIEDGVYVVNIDYPGVPMDTSSFIEFTFGPSVGLKTIELAALITPTGIKVEQTNALGFEAIEDFTVYPNPARDQINISYLVGISMKDLVVRAWSADGKLVHQEALPHQRGHRSKELSVADWQPGIYYLVVENSRKDVIIQWKLVVGD